MRHVNPNMVQPVLAGIEAGEALADQGVGDWVIAAHTEIIAEQTAALQPQGDRPFVVGAFLKARAIAYSQGLIAGYRSATTLDEPQHFPGGLWPETLQELREDGAR